jgi:hypothetical protein
MKRLYSLAFVFVLAGLLAGCITVFVPVNTPTPAPTAIILSTLPPPTSTSVVSPTSRPQAPVCAADPLAGACSLPTGGMLNKSCNKKVPYTFLGFSAGSTLEVTDPTLICKDEGLRGGVQQFSCTGQQLISYEIKVCNPACTASLETGTGQCADGYGYSAAAGCCWPLSDVEPGCIEYKVDIGGCQ